MLIYFVSDFPVMQGKSEMSLSDDVGSFFRFHGGVNKEKKKRKRT